MSDCRRDDNTNCNRDYWFRTGNNCSLRCCNDCCPRCDDCHSGFRSHYVRPIRPNVLQAAVVIPRTVIPIQIVLSPTISPFLVAQQNLGFETSVPSSLQSISGLPQIVTGGTGIPFSNNLGAGNGIYPDYF